MILFYVFIFLVSCFCLCWAGKWAVRSLVRIARFLGWREFVVAFMIMAVAGSLPNLFVGISSALHNIPQLSFGDIVGGNLIDLTVTVAIGALIAKGGLPARSRMVQTTSVFTMAIAILPLLLILDGTLGRGDGIILISTFIFYAFWLFSEKERFTKVYDDQERPVLKGFKAFIKDVGRLIAGITLLLLSSEGIVESAYFFAQNFHIPIVLIGIFIVGLGNSLPEIYFTIISARSNQAWMIMGNLMGAVIIPTTWVLGVVALLCPIEIANFSPFAVGRFFLIISAIFFLFFVRTDRKITKKEAVFLFFIYLMFVAVEILTK